MNIKVMSRGKNKLEIALLDQDHTLANLVRELSWKRGGEAAYEVEHPLTGKPVVKIFADDPKKVLAAAAKDISSLASKVEKAFK